MRIAIIEIYPNKTFNLNKAIDAHLRNSIIISKYLKADLLCIESDFQKAFKKKYDVFILGYASSYAPFRSIKKLLELNPEATKIVLSNEYNINPSISGFKPFYLISNYKKVHGDQKNIIDQTLLNLNYLFARKPNKLDQKKYDCIYYGTFRENRAEYFKKYLQHDIYVSTSNKNFKKYKHIGANPKFIKKLSWIRSKETLNNFRYSLYIEDDYTHDHFNNLANRYYEAGFCNCVMFFDKNCINTIRKSELKDFEEEVKEYIVKDYKELQNKITECNKDFEYHLQKQRNWRMNELLDREQMLHQLKGKIEEFRNRDIKKPTSEEVG